MSQSRLEKLGTVYSRTRNLLRTGTLRQEFKPVWYDIYEAFPPKHEPRWDRPIKECKTVQILYKEDEVRAKFYKNFGDRHEVVNLLDPSWTPLSQNFIRKYQALEAEDASAGGVKSADELFLATVDALEAEGLPLRSLDPEAAAEGRWTKEVERFKAKEERVLAEERDTTPKISFKEIFSKGVAVPSDKVE